MPNVNPEALFKEVGTVVGFFLLFSPGFVTVTVYQTFTVSEPRKIGEVVYEILGYGCLTYAVSTPFVLWFISDKKHFTNFWTIGALLVVVLLIVPTAFALIALLRDRIADNGKATWVPTKKMPWDYVFAKGPYFAVVITFADNSVIGGRYSERGFASHFPYDHQILLDEVWELDDAKHFVRKVPKSEGVIVLSKDIKTLEMFDLAVLNER